MQYMHALYIDKDDYNVYIPRFSGSLYYSIGYKISSTFVILTSGIEGRTMKMEMMI